jgi:Rrf2 family protein
VSANSKLTTAVHALCWLELARRRDRLVLTSAEVAASLDSHPVLVRRCLASLKEAGLVSSSRGPGAGWSLARNAETISLGEVCEAVGDDDIFALHPHEPNLECPVGFGIRPVLDEIYAETRSAVLRALGERTIHDVLEQTLDVSAGHVA